MLNQHGLTLSEHLPKLPAKEPQAETFNSKKISARDIIKGEGLLERAYTTKYSSLHTHTMAAQEGNGPASQVKIHLTTRDQNIQLPQDTGSILVATGKCL